MGEGKQREPSTHGSQITEVVAQNNLPNNKTKQPKRKEINKFKKMSNKTKPNKLAQNTKNQGKTEQRNKNKNKTTTTPKQNKTKQKQKQTDKHTNEKEKCVVSVSCYLL